MQDSKLLGEFQLSSIDMLDANDAVLRMITSETPAGVWYFDSIEVNKS